MYSDRIDLIKALEQIRGSRVIVYITGDRPPNLQTQIAPDIYDIFADHLDSLGTPKKVSLYLYSEGGITLVGWSLVRLIRQYCERFEVIIPRKAHSTATLIAIGADNILMTKQATLGPVDPSVNGPLNPLPTGIQTVPGQMPQTVPVSVEAVNGYKQLAKDEFGLEGHDLESVYRTLSEMVHPIALGNVYRARTQIKMLAERLLQHHMDRGETLNNIVEFLCSKTGSHDYTINRREAKVLGLPIETPGEEEYATIRALYNSIKEELQLGVIFNPAMILEDQAEKHYSVVRGLIESSSGGSHKFVTHGLIKNNGWIQGPMNLTVPAVMDYRIREGWEYEQL